MRGGGLLAIVREDGDAALVELSSLTLAHNFGDTLRRYPEAYHEKVQQGSATAESNKGEGITSAHDRIAFLHTIEAADTEPDLRPRGLFVDFRIAADGSRHALNNYQRGDAPGHYLAQGDGWRIEKRYRLDADALVVEYTVNGNDRLETQLNLAMPSCDGYGGCYMLADGSIPCGFGQLLEIDNLTLIRLMDSELGGKLEITVSPESTFAAAPHRTVSQSEAGFEKVMQAACLTIVQPADGEFKLTLRAVANS